MNKAIVSLVLAMSVLMPAQAQPMVCGKKDYARMSQKKLMETYCSADQTLAGAMSPTVIDDERAADLQRECLDEKGNVEKILQQKFKSAPPKCNPLIESPKK
jgi:hypothetical protein